MAREFSKHSTIWVSNLPDEATESNVKIHFQRRKNGGGEVTEVQMIPDSHEALVVFEEEEVANAVVKKEHTILGKVVQVELYKEMVKEVEDCKMAREFSKHSTIWVSYLPDEATESSVKIHFQRRKNGGGEVTEVQMIPDSHEALVVFEEEEVANAVVKKEHTILGKVVQVELYKEMVKEVEEIHNNITTVLVSDLPEGVTKNAIVIYFQKKKNGGGEVESVTLLPEGHALVVFHDPKVARAVLSKEHAIKGKVVKVKPPEPESQVLKTRVLVSDLPECITENEIHIHFQKKKNQGGEIREVKLLSKGKVLVVFKDPKVASAVVEKEQVLKGKPVKVQIMESEEQEEPNINGSECKDNRFPGDRQDMAASTEPEVPKEYVSIQQMTKGKVNKDSFKSPTTINKETANEFLSMSTEKGYLGKTIIVSDIPDGISETNVLLYFQKKSNGGGEVGEVKLFSEHRTALVVFEEVQVAENVIQKEHMLKGQQVRVNKYNPKAKVTKVDCVFAVVTATINPSLLQNIEPTQCKAMLDETQEVTGIQWHHSAYGLLITGSLEQVKKADDVLKSKLSKSCSEQPNSEQHQRWSEIAKRPNAEVSGYQGDSGMTSADTEHDPEGFPSQIIGSNTIDFTEWNLSHRNTEPSRNFVTEENNQGEKQRRSDNAWMDGWTGDQRSRDSNVLRKKPEDSGELTPTYEHRASFNGPEVNNQDIAKNPLEMRTTEDRSIPRQPSSETSPRNSPRNEAAASSPKRELKTPADFKKPIGRNVEEQGSAISPGQQMQSSCQRQNNASVDTALPDEYQTRIDQTRSPSKVDRRPNAACFRQEKRPQNVENNSLQGEATAGAMSPPLRMGLENSQGILQQQSAEENDSSGDYFRRSSGGEHQFKSDESDGGDLPNDAHDSGKPTAVGYERNQGTPLDIIENAFQQMNLDEESSSTHVAQFILQVYKNDVEMFKSQHGVDVVFSEDQKRLTVKPMTGFDMSRKDEVKRKFQQFYEATSKKLKEVTIDLREFTGEDIEKIKESMSRQKKQFDMMIEESNSNRDVYTLVGDAENVEMFRKNVIGAFRNNSPVSKETLPAEPIVASRKGVRVILMQGDIEKQECDAIVNFTDKELVHKTGIASAIKEGAGMSFWIECREIIAKNGPLLSNMVTITTAGSLPCQHVIHAILPQLSKERRQENWRHGLQETCRLALNKAKENHMRSICFPVVTPDLANLSSAVSSHVLFAVITEFIEGNSLLNDNSIEEIRIIYRKNSSFAEEYKNEFSKNL